MYGEDPTTHQLEIRAPEHMNRESNLFVPTGTMEGQAGIRWVNQYHIDDSQIDQTGAGLEQVLT